MRYVYPVRLTKDEEGRYIATSRDVPEAITDGATRHEARCEMSIALASALAGYSLEGLVLPEPSTARRGECLVPVEPLVAAKLALRAALRGQGISNVALAEQLGISEGAVRRLVNPDHSSRLDSVVAALSAIGHELVIEDRESVEERSVCE